MVPAFVPARPASVAASLETNAVHVWLLPYARGAGRGPLRELLAGYLGLPGAQIAFQAGPHGRPGCAAAAAAGIDFNWSHSGSHALAVLARGLPELGIDLEIRHPRQRALALAQRFFAPAEHRWLATRASAELEPAFLRLWTAKEAVLKALGQGLQYGLDRVVFAIDDTAIRALAFAGPAAPADTWQLHPVPVSDAFACVAWRGDPRDVHLFRAGVSSPTELASSP